MAALDEAMGSIFVNPGGPGASGVDFVANGFRLDSESSKRFDLIGFDPRGIARSAGLACAFDRSQGPLPDFSPDNQGEAAALDDQAQEIAQSCGQLDADLLPHLTTPTVARDLDLLREAVGDDQLHYLGFSYGTLLGLAYAELYPERVGHLVLDGLVDPTASLAEALTGQAGGFESALAELDRACSDRLDCPPGGALAAHDTLIAELERIGPQGQVGTTEVEMAALVTAYDDRLWPRYVDALDAAIGGDYGQLESLSDSYLGGSSFVSYVAVTCTDSPRPTTPEGWDQLAADLTGHSPRFGATLANELRTCAHWTVPAAPEHQPVVAAGAEPILVIGTTNDPATPLTNAERVAATLDDARLVVFDGDRHLAYGASQCVRDIVMRYLIDDEIPAATTHC
ncbi:MAG: alpha/beta hydrolase [Actinomycetia bacterium]|nr:alpha/beta hydrolase [Actinomycetes bacterium]MCP5030379.1 alpha/beta hydrolase [Actinomycetes bacterium]